MNLHIIQGLGVGGAENVFVEIVQKHVSLSNVVIICILGCQEDKKNVERLSNEGFEVVKIFDIKSSEYSLSFRFFNLLAFFVAPLIGFYILVRTPSISKVFTHMPLALYIGVWIKWLRKLGGSGTILVDTFHTNWYMLKFYYKILFHFLHRRCDSILVEMGLEEYENFQMRYPDISIYYLPFYNLYLNDEFPVMKNFTYPIQLLVPMRITFHEKPIELLLNGFAHSKLCNHKNFQLNFVGDGKDFDKLEILVVNSKCNNIKLFGSDPELSKNYTNYDLCFAALGNSELGIAAIESFKNGLGVVGIGLGKFSGENVLVSIKSSSEMVVLFNELLNTDKIMEIFERTYNFFEKKVKDGVALSEYKQLYN